jgi:MerR family transcriptional regulator, heat shock protein HspR
MGNKNKIETFSAILLLMCQLYNLIVIKVDNVIDRFYNIINSRFICLITFLFLGSAQRSGNGMRDKKDGVYIISVAARLTGVHPRTLRIYEEEGLIEPYRTEGNIRLYCERDIKRVTYIRYLTQEEGVNLAGVKIILQLKKRLGELEF